MMESMIAKDIAEKRLLESVANPGGEKPNFTLDGNTSQSVFVQSLQGLIDHWVGYLVVVAHDFEDGGKNVTNSAAVRVDNIAEVVRVLEVLFKR